MRKEFDGIREMIFGSWRWQSDFWVFNGDDLLETVEKAIVVWSKLASNQKIAGNCKV